MAIAIRQESRKINHLGWKEKKRIRDRLEKILSVLRCDDAYLSVLLTSSERMRELNRIWRGQSRAARILSFPQERKGIPARVRQKAGPSQTACVGATYMSPLTGRVLGDLAIRGDRSISDRMLIHGVLHLLGYEHHTEKKYAEMRAKEKEVLKAILADSRQRTVDS